MVQGTVRKYGDELYGKKKSTVVITIVVKRVRLFAEHSAETSSACHTKRSQDMPPTHTYTGNSNNAEPIVGILRRKVGPTVTRERRW